ncbi:MAG: AMP-binding protein [Spirochaetales bacterium]|nr:AMP-binding protein [Spirochaetales bacterium]
MLVENRNIDTYKQLNFGSPANIAVKTREESRTYGKIHEDSNKLANFLLDSFKDGKKTMALSSDMCIEFIIGVLGAFKAGFNIIPIDCSLPPKKIENLLKTADVDCFLDIKGFERNYHVEIVSLDDDRIREGRADEIPENVQRDLPSLIQYISDSTGKPEGRVINYKTIMDWVQFNTENLKIDFSKTLFMGCSEFISLFPLWFAVLIKGGELTLYKSMGRETPDRLDEYTEDYTSIVFPFHLIDTIYNNHHLVYKCRHLVSMGEEILNIASFKEFLKEKGIRWFNYFGFPDIQMITTVKELAEDSDFHHFGKPVSNTRGYILDDWNNLLPMGMEGNLFFSGRGIVDGFYGNEGLQEKRFITNPFETGANLFDTGFKAKILPDGLFAVMGRKSAPGTIRGKRISSEEVERILLNHPSVEACAAVSENTNGFNRIKVFIVLSEYMEFEELESRLRDCLPEEAFPVGFIPVSTLPHDNEGKIDKRLLQRLKFCDNRETLNMENQLVKDTGINELAIVFSENKHKENKIFVRELLPELYNVKQREISTFETGVQKASVIREEYAGTPLSLIEGVPVPRDDENYPNNLIEIFLRAAGKDSSRGILYVNSRGEETFQSYGEILNIAKSILTGLMKANLNPGDYVILQIEDLEDYYPVFWACILGGIIPSTVAIPRLYNEKNSGTEKLFNVWKLLDKPVIISSERLVDALHDAKTVYPFDSLSILSVDDLRDNSPTEDFFMAGPQDTAYFQLTSGSTGIPKCIPETHAAIINHNVQYYRLNNYKETYVSLNWMPVDHIVPMVHLKDVQFCCRQIQVKTRDILDNPFLWFDLMEKYKVAFSWAPNFAFNMINKLLAGGVNGKWDLSCLHNLQSAGEQVTYPVVAEFLKLTKPFGIRESVFQTAFGMAETCTGVIYCNNFSLEKSIHFVKASSLSSALVKTEASDPEGVSLIEVGEPLEEISVRITDAGNNILPEGFIGRLQLKGNVIMPGYFKSEEENKKAFLADGWFDTGDLAVMFDKRIAIAGRKKEMLVIGGANYYSHDIENAIADMEEIEINHTGVCSVHNHSVGTEDLVVFFSPKATENTESVKSLINKIRQRIQESIGVNPAVIVPLKKEDFPKTTSGKVQRAKLKDNYVKGVYDAILAEYGLHTDEDFVPDWFYEKKWVREDLCRLRPKREGRNYLLFSDSNGLSDKIASALRRTGKMVIEVGIGDKFEIENEGRVLIRAMDAEDYKKLIEYIECRGIVIDTVAHFWTYYPGKKIINIDQLREAQSLGVYSLLNLIQALEAGNHRDGIGLFVVSSNGDSVLADDDAAFEKSSLSGFLRTIPLEMSHYRCIAIDLDGDSVSDSAIGCLMDEFSWNHGQSDVAFRKGNRYALYLSKVDCRNKFLKKKAIQRDGLYIMTGGLGGIGHRLAKWLISKFNVKLIIIGRTVLPEEGGVAPDSSPILDKRIRAYREIQSTNGRFIYMPGDIADPDFIGECIKRGEAHFSSPLSGVFHLAGDVSRNNGGDAWESRMERFIAKESIGNFESVFRAKVYGTLNLHNCLRDRKDLLFVAFSSVNGFFGGSATGAYSSSNSFLDGFMLYRRLNRYENSYSFGWSMWQGVGMSENIPENLLAVSKASGYYPIDELKGVFSLLVGLSINSGQLYIGLNGQNRSVEKHLAQPFESEQSLTVGYRLKEGENISGSILLNSFRSILDKTGHTHNVVVRMLKMNDFPQKENGEINRAELKELMESADMSTHLDEPANDIEMNILAIVKEILGKSHIGVNDNIFSHGFNSIMITQLAYKIKELTGGSQFSMDFIFQRPSIRGIGEMIEEMSNGGQQISPDGNTEKVDFASEAVLDEKIKPGVM